MISYIQPFLNRFGEPNRKWTLMLDFHYGGVGMYLTPLLHSPVDF